MAYPKDPGAHFDSDVHRRVLGHLSLPSDKFGWSVEALYNRLRDSAGVAFEEEHAELERVLRDLEKSGFAEEVNDVWRQTKEGFDKLNAEVPEHARGKAGPAVVSAATPIGEPSDEAPGPSSPAQIVPDTRPSDAGAQEVSQ